MKGQLSKLGKVAKDFDVFDLKNVLVKNDAGEWGNEPDNNAIGVIRSTNFSNEGKLDLSNVAYRTLKPAKRIEKLLFQGDILVERSGGSDSQPVGRVGLITEEIAKTNWAFANFIQRISLDDSVNSEFLYYCLQQMYEMGITASMQYQTTGIRNLDWKLYLKTVLPKPPKPEQTAIATILSKVDAAIEAAQKSIKTAEKLKKSLMQNLLTGKLKPDGTWRKEDEFYEDEKFGKVPKGWTIEKVKKLTNRVTDGEHLSPDFQSSGAYLLSAENINHEGISFKKVKYVKPKDCQKFRKRCNPDYGDVLIVSRGASIGRTCKVNSEVKFCLMGSVILIKPNNHKLHGEFLAQYLKSYRAWIELQRISGTTAQQAIYLTHIKKINIPFPKDVEEQKIISNKLKFFDNYIASKQTKIQTLQRLKKSLMQHLLTGKVRVDVDKVNEILKGQEYE